MSVMSSDHSRVLILWIASTRLLLRKATQKKVIIEPEIEPSPKSKRRVKERFKIEDLLKPGQEIMVQVTKDIIGTKGPG